jgi:hypothetical protein
MNLNQFRRLGTACILALLTLSSPAQAVSVPSAEEDGLGHFLGCFSVLLDSITHAEYCGPSQLPLELTSLGAGGDGGSKPPAPPSCDPCGGAQLYLPPLQPYQVASLSYGMLAVPAKPSRWELLMACCPGGNN